ncbi:hypothetical protein IFM89_028422 [Coptis chinensis]|uniref:FHA domain-containing protein n=1 Tax=Coptis chinensis TaxID=261450 RepID=A0A835MCA9_9MAGN|nr:hypothetical protein IFM89_028422 [Coptis chinensis]
MGALAPMSMWIPQDDLLLKNAVEAGASLEALAKGAVRFSRRFSIQELQNRWLALLYDPDTSGPASASMVELEHSASDQSSESNKLCDFKGNGTPVKRKEESVRRHYYAMRKRIRNEPFSNVDLSFLHTCSGTEGGCGDQVTVDDEHPLGDCMVGDHVDDHFDLHDTNFDILDHGYQQVVRPDNSADSDQGAAHAFHSGHQDLHVGEIPDGIMGRNCLYEFADNVPHVSGNEAIGCNVPHSFEHGNVHNNMNILGENLSVFETISHVQEIGPPQLLPGSNLFENADPTTKSSSEFNPVSDSPILAGFVQSQGFSSPVSDCTATFHQMEYSSPIPTMPIWRTMDNISTPSIMTNDNLDDKDNGAGAIVVCSVDNAKQVSSSGYGVVHRDAHLEERMSDDGLKNSRIMSEGDFMDYSDSLLNFTNEEVLLFIDDDDGKDIMDRSCLDGLSSILLNSPIDVHQEDIPGITQTQASVALESGLVIPDIPCSGELDVFSEKLQTCESNISLPPFTLLDDPNFPERRNGVICCVLSTEDPDIPDNDDVILPSQVLTPSIPYVLSHESEEDGSSFPSSTLDLSLSRKASEWCLNNVKDEESLATSRMTESQLLPEMCSNNPIASGLVSESVTVDMGSRHVDISEGEPCHSGSAHLTPYSVSAGEMNEDITQVGLGTLCEFDSSIDFLLEGSIHCPDNTENHRHNVVNGYKQELNVAGAIQNNMAEEHGSFDMPFPQTLVIPSISDQEEEPFEDGNDVPHFSDVEAMMLDMDLGPCDQDSYFSREVSRYQHEEAKRAILRLEQGADSYKKRAIAAHGAFAVLYGRRLKYYIKKREVSLGRVTEDISVDIDLAKEGAANKISRRQAIIKMEQDGSFTLKNIGKGLISANGKEVASGHCIKLVSCCLIEFPNRDVPIRSMSFIFETNLKMVKQYLANTAKKSQGKSLKYEWSPKEVS